MALESTLPVVSTGDTDLDDQLRACVAHFEEAENSSWESRKLSERDRDYYDNDQWTAEELAILRKRKQPALTINHIRRKVEFLRGFERRVRSDPKAFPRNPDDERGAEAATDGLRYVGDQNAFNQIRSDVYENMLIEGTGGVDVIVERTPNDEAKIITRQVPWNQLFWDPHSAKKDFNDAKYKGVVLWMDSQDAEDQWPDATDAIESTMSSASISNTYDDKPQRMIWCDSRRKRVRIVQIHYQWHGEWMVATFTRGGFLDEPMVSPYLDKDGRSCSSLIIRSAYVDRENNRYGDVRAQISLQDEINKRRSKALHLLSVRQTYGSAQALQDTQKAKIELAKPDGHVEMNSGSKFGQDFGVIPTGDLAQGQIALLQQATQEMQASGPNNALAGKNTETQSGRAIQAQQQGGAVEIEPGIDDLRQWSRDVYEAVWMRIKQFWTEEKWVRVTDDERNIKWVGLNKKVTLEDKLATVPPEIAQQYTQQMQIQPGDPRLQEVVEVENDVSGLDVDIVVEEGPDISSLQSEQFETLSNLAKAGIQIPPKAIVQASSIRNKDQILDEMEKGQALPPQVQKQMDEMQQQLQAMQQELQQKNQQLADRSQEFQLKQQELGLKEKEIDSRSAIALSKPGKTDTPPTAIEQAKDIADIGKTHAETEQIVVETELAIGQAFAPMPPAAGVPGAMAAAGF